MKMMIVKHGATSTHLASARIKTYVRNDKQQLQNKNMYLSQEDLMCATTVEGEPFMYLREK